MVDIWVARQEADGVAARLGRCVSLKAWTDATGYLYQKSYDYSLMWVKHGKPLINHPRNHPNYIILFYPHSCIFFQIWHTMCAFDLRSTFVCTWDIRRWSWKGNKKRRRLSQVVECPRPGVRFQMWGDGNSWIPHDVAVSENDVYMMYTPIGKHGKTSESRKFMKIIHFQMFRQTRRNFHPNLPHVSWHGTAEHQCPCGADQRSTWNRQDDNLWWAETWFCVSGGYWSFRYPQGTTGIHPESTGNIIKKWGLNMSKHVLTKIQ